MARGLPDSHATFQSPQRRASPGLRPGPGTRAAGSALHRQSGRSARLGERPAYGEQQGGRSISLCGRLMTRERVGDGPVVAIRPARWRRRPIGFAHEHSLERSGAGVSFGRDPLARSPHGSTAQRHGQSRHTGCWVTPGACICSEAESGYALGSSVGLRATSAKTWSASMRPSPSTIAAAASGESSSRSTIARDSQRTASWACSTSDGGSRFRRAASRSGAAMS